MENFELTPEILSKAAQCETAEEIQNNAKECGEDITLEQAQRVFDMSHTNGAVSDEELESVAGGGALHLKYRKDCPYCQAVYIDTEDVKKHISERHPGKLNEYLAMLSTPNFNHTKMEKFK